MVPLKLCYHTIAMIISSMLHVRIVAVGKIMQRNKERRRRTRYGDDDGREGQKKRTMMKYMMHIYG